MKFGLHIVESPIPFRCAVETGEPGYGPTTRFANNGYAPFARQVFAAFAEPTMVTTESNVAEVLWRAANDTTGQLRFPAGADALALAQSR